jgi:hypothetical protein
MLSVLMPSYIMPNVIKVSVFMFCLCIQWEIVLSFMKLPTFMFSFIMQYGIIQNALTTGATTLSIMTLTITTLANDTQHNYEEKLYTA